MYGSLPHKINVSAGLELKEILLCNDILWILLYFYVRLLFTIGSLRISKERRWSTLNTRSWFSPETSRRNVLNMSPNNYICIVVLYYRKLIIKSLFRYWCMISWHISNINHFRLDKLFDEQAIDKDLFNTWQNGMDRAVGYNNQYNHELLQ